MSWALLALVLTAGAWLAVYHVLQRYGAFVAMRRFTKVFGASGAFTDVPADESR